MAEVATPGVEKSLDDFFAKRDKKKKKEKGKGKDAGPVSAPAAAVKKTRKEKEKSMKNDNQDPTTEKEDEEWKEFEQKEVDYTGLRLQALQITDEKEEEEYEKEEVDEYGENIMVSGDKVSGPWNKSGPPPPAAPVEEKEIPESKPAGVYRPPGARLGSSKKVPTQGPPEIYNDTQFPSLLATAKHVETRKKLHKCAGVLNKQPFVAQTEEAKDHIRFHFCQPKQESEAIMGTNSPKYDRDREIEKTFEVVKHKSRAREGEGQGAVQHLQLDNQFAVLEDK